MFWARWSLRDLRGRWVQVAVIALVIAIGTGVYAGMSSMLSWRRASYDESYASLRAHDVRVELPADSYVPEGDLAGALSRMRDPELVEASEERLVVPTQVEADSPGGIALVPGRLVGVAVGGGGPRVDGVKVTAGSAFKRGAEAVLEKHFADERDLPDEGVLKLAGDVPLRYSGVGLSPEYFVVTSGQGDFMSQGDFAVLFVPLPEAQQLAGQAGRVNDLVVRVRPGADRKEAAREVEEAMKAALPGLSIDVGTIEDDPAYNMMYEDLDSDRGTTMAIAFLVLIAAAFAAFTLTSRIVEAERREIGIDMALGVPRATIALRPLLGAVWIATLGIVFGAGMGYLFVWLLRTMLEGQFPLPVWVTPLEAGPFLAAAAIGFVIPFAASVWPVWRAVRVEPIEAIRTGHLAARGGGLAPFMKRLRLPGKSLVQIPLRNLLRAPRRTVLTAIGIGVAIVTLVAMTGMLDSLNETMARVSSEVKTGAADRLVVTLAGFQPLDSPLVRQVRDLPSSGELEQDLALGAIVSKGKEELKVRLQALDLESPIWHPTVTSPVDPGDLPGIVLSSKAARDLGLSPGETLEVKHPFRTGASAMSVRTTRMRLSGEHSNPMRFLAYTDIANAGVFGLEGYTNELEVVPADDGGVLDLKRGLFGLAGVAAVQEPASAVDTTREQISRFSGVFRVVDAFALFLALLIAFIAASIGTDERARENATMMAFGVRVRTLLRMSVLEGIVLGVLGTLIGIGLGILALHLLIARTASTFPDMEILTTVRPATVLIILFFGVLAVGIAPLFTGRKLLRTDVPSTLRVME